MSLTTLTTGSPDGDNNAHPPSQFIEERGMGAGWTAHHFLPFVDSVICEKAWNHQWAKDSTLPWGPGLGGGCYQKPWQIQPSHLSRCDVHVLMVYIHLFREYDPRQVCVILSRTIQIRRNWLWLPQAIQHHANLLFENHYVAWIDSKVML